MNGARPAGTFRLEIQGLRAIAVLLVLLYHIWPESLPGGYVGVDVFFVISGYLITNLLFRELQATGRLSVSGFYVRRIKRLLPAATFTLLAVLGASLYFLPLTQWQDVAQEVVASALYVENWLLIWQAVDYQALGNAASPVRHYWSLSVEEQFYIVWPLLMLATAKCAGRAGVGLRQAVFVLLGLVGGGSLIYSILATTLDPAAAYFSTWTRIWELALGGLLTLLLPQITIGERVRTLLGWVGCLAIVASAIGYSDATSFPGYAALVPTMGAVCVIVAGVSQQGVAASSILKTRPFQYVGDISYALYLWHWPVIAFHGIVTQRTPGVLDGLLITLCSIALAHISKIMIEDPIHHSHVDLGHTWKPFALGTGCIAGCLLAAGSLYGYTEQLQQEQMARLTEQSQYLGANALAAGSNAEGTEGQPQYLGAGALAASQNTEATDEPPQYVGAAALAADRRAEDAGASPGYLGTEALAAGGGSNRREEPPQYLGAGALAAVASAAGTGGTAAGTDGSDPPPFVPDVLTAKKGKDRKQPWCSTDRDSAEVEDCVYGSKDSDHHVVLVGDSKANQLVPAMKALAEQEGWKLNVYAKVGCALADVTQRSWEGSDRDNRIPYETCDEWNEKVLKTIEADKPELVITSSMHSTYAIESDSREESNRLVVSAFRRTWRRIAAEGIRIVVLRDTPSPGFNVPDCVAQNMDALDECAVSRDEALDYFDPLVEAAKDNEDVTLVDLTDAICTADECPPVVGNILVYRDHHHLTSTYVESMIPFLQASDIVRQ